MWQLLWHKFLFRIVWSIYKQVINDNEFVYHAASSKQLERERERSESLAYCSLQGAATDAVGGASRVLRMRIASFSLSYQYRTLSIACQ